MKRIIGWMVCLCVCAMLVCPALAENIPIDEAHFPDDAFRAYVLDKIDEDKDGTLNDRERNKTIDVNVSGMSIASMKGVEFLTGMRDLICSNNQLTSLTIEGFPNLWELRCENNQLTSLNLRDLPKLTNLGCHKNQLTELDVGNLPNLKQLWCYDNRLTELDVSMLTGKLSSISCGKNQLTKLKIGDQPNLRSIACAQNQLTKLDVSGLVSLKTLLAFENQLISLDLGNLTLLEDVKIYGNLRSVTAENGKLDLSALPGFDVNRASGWQGGTVTGTILNVKESGSVTYTYDCGSGYSETFTLNVTVTGTAEEDPVNKPGNVNGDESGTVDGRDLLRLARYLAGQDVTINQKASDVNGDGTVDGRDLLRLARYLAGQNVKLGN